ncbi:MAG: M56 family metallopeptidase [Lachnospiraceae bacterium]|nr:M56 family metallopeptidase [Lachnospiraceae bacterium]MDE7202779.1 M56 family metallopeptidase [Lachnospiraceae bacterium]
MKWKISDILILILTLAISINVLIVVISLCKGYLEKKMEMSQLSCLLKIVVLFHFFVMPVLSGVILYKSVYVGKAYLESDDFPYWDIINKSSLSQTRYGNHWILILLFSIWLLGFIYAIYKYVQDGILLQKLKKCSTHHCSAQVDDVIKALMPALGLKHSVALLQNEIVQSPFMTGVLRPKIFLPERSFTQTECELLLKHELIHCKNRDCFFRRLVFILCALYWFNPFFSRFAEYFIEVNEMACDQKVLDGQPSGARSLYAELILQMQERASGLMAVSLTGHTVNGLERRIGNIMKKNKTGTKLSVAVISAVMVLFCPLTVSAASVGMANIQDWAVETFVVTRVEVEQEIPYMPEITEYDDSHDVIEYPLNLNARGASKIDVTVKGTDSRYASDAYLPSGSKVSFVLQSDSSSNRFSAGVEDSENKKTYVNSSDGWLEHTIRIEQSGNYTIFIEGTSSNSIHVVGSIIIFN